MKRNSSSSSLLIAQKSINRGERERCVWCDFWVLQISMWNCEKKTQLQNVEWRSYNFIITIFIHKSHFKNIFCYHFGFGSSLEYFTVFSIENHSSDRNPLGKSRTDDERDKLNIIFDLFSLDNSDNKRITGVHWMSVRTTIALDAHRTVFQLLKTITIIIIIIKMHFAERITRNLIGKHNTTDFVFCEEFRNKTRRVIRYATTNTSAV